MSKGKSLIWDTDKYKIEFEQESFGWALMHIHVSDEQTLSIYFEYLLFYFKEDWGTLIVISDITFHNDTIEEKVNKDSRSEAEKKEWIECLEAHIKADPETWRTDADDMSDPGNEKIGIQ